MNTRKSKIIPILPSRITVEGLDRAPHRAFLRGLGLSDAGLKRPFVGVASTDGRVTPCNALLGALAKDACAGVRDAGGVPFDFASIAVADSMSMNHAGMRYSLVSREIIADGVEAVVRGHAYDALGTFACCDKTLPGMMMAMVRLNLPSLFMYAGAARRGRLPGELVTRRSLENACAAVAATGGSTNAGLHIPAIAHEAGIKFSLDDLARVSKRTPYIADMKPGGRFLSKDLHKVGGVYAVLKELLKRGVLHGDCLTIFGTSLESELKEHPGADGKVIPRKAISETGGIVVLKGNLAPDGALLKVAGLKSLRFERSARVFDSEEACVDVVRRRAYKV